MKRLVSILVLILMMVNVSVAEEFTLRNGIMFGDTMEEVRQKETIAIDEERSTQTELKTEAGIVAGFDRTYVYYTFDDNKLVDILWRISMPTKDDLGSNYQLLKSSLSKKYGNPLGNTDGVYHVVRGRATQLHNEPAFLLASMMGDKMGIFEYDEWVYEYADEQSMKIELVQRYGITPSINLTSYELLVSYTHFESSLTDTVQNDILNDI